MGFPSQYCDLSPYPITYHAERLPIYLVPKRGLGCTNFFLFLYWHYSRYTVHERGFVFSTLLLLGTVDNTTVGAFLAPPLPSLQKQCTTPNLLGTLFTRGFCISSQPFFFLHNEQYPPSVFIHRRRTNLFFFSPQVSHHLYPKEGLVRCVSKKKCVIYYAESVTSFTQRNRARK